MATWKVITSDKPRRKGEAFIKRDNTFVIKVYADSVDDTKAFAEYLARQLARVEARSTTSGE